MDEAPNGVEMLVDDHRRIKALVDSLQADPAGRVDQLARELRIHAALEDDIFHPELVAGTSDADRDTADAGDRDNDVMLDLVRKLETLQPGDEERARTVDRLTNTLDRHIEREEQEMFPTAQQFITVNLNEVGALMQARRSQMEAEASPNSGERSAGD